MQNIECIADVLVLIAGSERLLGAIREIGVQTILREDKLLIHLGWFRDPDGTIEWRIKVIDDEHEAQMQLIRLGSEHTSSQEDTENESHHTQGGEKPVPRVSVHLPRQRLLISNASTYAPVLDLDIVMEKKKKKKETEPGRPWRSFLPTKAHTQTRSRRSQLLSSFHLLSTMHGRTKTNLWRLRFILRRNAPLHARSNNGRSTSRKQRVTGVDVHSLLPKDYMVFQSNNNFEEDTSQDNQGAAISHPPA